MKIPKTALYTGLIIAILPVAVFGFFMLFFPVSLNSTPNSFATVVVAENGRPLRAFADTDGVWRYAVNLEDVSPLYLDALLTYEDRFFYQHPGVNPYALCRALMLWLKQGRIVSGGSTLTMQVARLLAPHDKTVLGKLKQMSRALQLEWRYDKNTILTYYLNHAPFGGAIEGVQAASYSYLGKPVSDLTHAEAALLAVLPQAPSHYRPDRYPEVAAKARNKVLQRLKTQNIWDQNTIQQAMLEPIIAQRLVQPVIAPLLARRLKNQFPGRSNIQTTIDLDLQLTVEMLLKQYVNRLPEQTSGAVIVVENATLKTLAYAGSADFSNLKRYAHVDMIQAIRSPGSTLKPFLYGMAIDQGLIHSQSLLTDAPITLERYAPQNFSRYFSGPVSVTQALRRSLNIPAIQVLHHLSPQRFVRQLENAGLDLHLQAGEKPNLAMILGGVGTRLESLVGVYSALANQGLAGHVRWVPEQAREQKYLMSPGAAWIVYDMLADDRHIAIKTGTSYGHRDLWSIGVSQDFTVGVWLGRPDGSPLPGEYGGKTATPLLKRIFYNLPDAAPINPPANVTEAIICWPLGTLQSEMNADLCHEKKQAWLLDHTIPKTLPDKDYLGPNPITIRVDPVTKRVIPTGCAKASVQTQVALWPLAVEPWIPVYHQRHYQIQSIDPACPELQPFQGDAMRIIGLENPTRLHAAGLNGALPKIALAAQGGQGQHYWLINGQLIYSVRRDQTVYHQFPSKGRFHISVIDEQGHHDSVWVEVI